MKPPSPTFIRRLTRQAGTFYVSIPKEIARSLGLEKGCYMKVRAEGEKIIVKAVK